MELDISSSTSDEQILVKGAGRGRERDETDLADRVEVNDAIAEGRAVGELNVVSRHVVDAK
jgi:hypothetical protein